MRTALLSAIEQTSDGTPRAFLEMGGRSIIAWQLDLAARLECERVVCLCSGPSPELLDLQQDAERRGMQFNLIRGPLQLVGLVSADHGILVIADGLAVDVRLGSELLGQGRGIATLPAEAGIPAGFERIDADHAWAGMLIARGSIVEKLADLPPDSDTIALLLRLALQSGVRRVELEKEALDSGELILATSVDKLGQRERTLLDRSVASAVWSGPGEAIAQRLARRLAPGALDRGPMIALAGSAMLAAASVGLASVGQSLAAVPALGISAFLLATSQALGGLRSRLFGGVIRRKFRTTSNALLDIAMIAVLTLPAAAFMLPRRVFLPLVMVGLLRLIERHSSTRWAAFWGDRTLLLLLLTPALWFGLQTQAMAGIILSVLVFGLLLPNKPQITAD